VIHKACAAVAWLLDVPASIRSRFGDLLDAALARAR